jgi:hypothetical protein
MAAGRRQPRRSSGWKIFAEVLGAAAALATVVALVVQVRTSDGGGGSTPTPPAPSDRNYQLYWDGSVRFSLDEHVDLDQRPPGPSPVEDNWGISGPDADEPEGALLAPRQGGIVSWGPNRPPSPAECRTVLAQGKRHFYAFAPAPSYLCLVTPQGRLARLNFVNRVAGGFETYYEFQITLWLIQ